MDALKDAIAIDRKDYALLFATDRYDNWGDLVNPINDAETIGKELAERYGFEVEIVKDANQDDVFNKLRSYAQRNYKPQDQLFIFFAGHGQYDETFGEGYIVAKNSLQNDQAKTSYISTIACVITLITFLPITFSLPWMFALAEPLTQYLRVAGLQAMRKLTMKLSLLKSYH